MGNKEDLPEPDPVCYSGGVIREQADPLIMVEVTIKLPDSLARTLGPTPEAQSQRLVEDAAIEEYRTGRLSQRQVGECLAWTTGKPNAFWPTTTWP